MTPAARRNGALCAAVLCWAAAGCATVASGGGGDQTVTITTTPPGAAVIVDGQPQGVTPAKLPLGRKAEHRVEITAPGYEAAVVTIRPHVNPWLLGNLLIGGIPGLLIDVVTDATHTLSPTELTVHLRSLSAPPAPSPAPAPPMP